MAKRYKQETYMVAQGGFPWGKFFLGLIIFLIIMAII